MSSSEGLTIAAELRSLADRWHERAAWHDLMARNYRRDGDPEAAEDHEAAAADYREALAKLDVQVIA